MKPRNARIAPREPGAVAGFVRWIFLPGVLMVFFVGLILAVAAAPSFSRAPAASQETPGAGPIPGVKSLIGLENIKPGATGTLSSSSAGLEFSNKKGKTDIAISSIQDVFTGQESRQDVSGMGGTLVEAAIPYGGGRVVSLFSHKVDVLTVEYTDSNGGFHGAIFLLSAGKAAAFKNQLVAEGAKSSTHMIAPEPKEQK